MENKGSMDETDGKKKDDIPPGYEEYLLLLQQRNRLLKKLKAKDKKQKELEKREQGFSLYLNGANVDLNLRKAEHRSSRKAKTADVENGARSAYSDEPIEDESSRAWTAPSKHARKGWGKSPTQIKIKTEHGGKLELNTGKVTGKYSEDFEAYQSFLEEQLADEDDDDEGRSGDEEVEGDELETGSQDTDDTVSSDVGDDKDRLTLTIDDVKALRRSLEANKEIAESIKSIQKSIRKEDSDAEEDIEEQLETLKNSRDIDPSELPQLGQTFPEEENTEVSVVTASYSETDNEKRESKESPEAKMQNTSYQPVEMISAPRKSRPLSANRKQRNDEHMPLYQSSEDILNAIQAENRSVNVNKNSQNFVDRESKSAPSVESKVEKEADSVQRPSSIAAFPVDNAMISEIVERVKVLSGIQQAHLLKMLTKLEELDVTEDDITFGTMFFEKSRQRLSTESGLVEPRTAQSKDKVLDEKESVECITSDSSKEQVDVDGIPKTTTVCLDIISNWGHADIVGLTEVDFFHEKEKAIRLKAENVEIATHHICCDPITNLINGKTKTTKERHMWKCKLISAEPVKLLFHIPDSSKSPTGHRISKIAIWNYNKSLYDLSAGVKEARISINGEVVWDGIVDKGCGNQVFDYSYVISLNDGEVSVSSSLHVSQNKEERCKTATLKRDSNELANLPKIESLLMDQRLRKRNENYEKSNEVEKYVGNETCPDAEVEEQHEVHVTPKPPSMKAEYPVRRSPMVRKHTPEVATHSEVQIPSTLVDHGSTSQEADTHLSQKPVWLPGEADLKVQSAPGIDDEIVTLSKPRSRPSSGRRAESNKSEDDVHSTSHRTASAGRRKGQHVKADDESIDIDGRNEAEDLQQGSKRKTPSSGRRSKIDNAEVSTDKLVQDQSSSQRKKYRELVDDELEQSLNSINIFDHSHLGRITSNLDLEKDQGDALDSLIKPHMPAHEISLRSSEGEEATPETSDTSMEFEIPTLPSGRNLVLNLKSTWGDKHYIGLNGIEVFTDKGELAKISQISANPADINILPEYEHDPRVVSNLIDGTYMTRDDLHLWLTPFTTGANHFVTLNFNKPVTIAMLRIWNYNKSRIHSTRGSRYVEITLDDVPIFKGEIARASGVLSKESEPYGDIILFTTDEDILEEVAKHDFTYEYDIYEEEEEQLMQSVEQNRPKTAEDEGDLMEVLERPYTCPKSRGDLSIQGITQKDSEQTDTDLLPRTKYTGKVVRLNFTQTWGDEYYLGLTGIEILGKDFEPIQIDFEWMDACPRDLNDLDDYDDDDRTLDKLIDGENVTNSDEHMWLIPFSEGEPHVITVRFPTTKEFTGIRVWNYNKSTEDTYRGAKFMQLFIDDVEVFPEHGFLLRKGPGHCHFDFAQDILFSQEEEIHKRKEIASETGRGSQDFQNMLPTGFVFQIRLLSTWGDPYYIGLNGIEFYDECGVKIPLDENNITAYPQSVNILEGIENDARTPEKLVDGVNDTYDASHMWLAPIFPGIVNVIYVVFDSPIALSMIKMWNYSKTGPRGVRQFTILVDDLLVYNGILPQITHHTRAILPQIDVPIPHHTILFTDDEEIFSSTPQNLISNVPSSVEQDVQMTNEKSIVNPYANPSSARRTADPANRPMTSVSSVKLRR